MPIIKLKSSDGDIFHTDAQSVRCSGAIQALLEEFGIDDGGNAVIPLPRVDSAILRKVLQWGNYHRYDAQPPKGGQNKGKRADGICQWDVNFLKVDEGTLLGLISAANYLDIKGLLDLTIKTVASRISGMSIEEIRRNYNIKNDFTPAEEEQVRKQDKSYKQS